MRRILYRAPSSPSIKYNPLLKYLVIDEYNPSMKGVFIEVVYSMIFSHHVPVLLKHGGFMGKIELFGNDSIADFLNSYVGKIIFFFLVYYILNFIVIPIIKKKYIIKPIIKKKI